MNPSSSQPTVEAGRSGAPLGCKEIFRVAAALLLCMPAACLPIPHPHRLQPAVTFQVADSAGQPVRGAAVRLYTAEYVINQISREESAATDSLGRAGFAEVKVWHPVTALMIESDPPKHWLWCVDALGFAPAIGQMAGATPAAVAVTLARADQPRRCARDVTDLHQLRNLPYMDVERSPVPSDGTGKSR